MIRCFWLEPTDQVEMTLRRFRSDLPGSCSSEKAYHDASVVIERRPAADCPDTHGDVWPHADPRWPATCHHCGYRFVESDHWQFNPHALYRRGDTGDLVTLGAAPVGSMWSAHWLRDVKRYNKPRPDGIVLVVRTPGGDWVVDGPSSNGDGWDRQGAVPNITATPSIVIGAYHGWLRDGCLVSV